MNNDDTVRSAPAAAAAPTKAPKQRIATWDNARFVLIVLVVIGHVISTVRTDSALGFGMYAYIYLFHMPAMIMLSGLFSKPEVTPKAIRSTVQLLATWLVWEGIWAVIRAVADGRPPGPGFLVSPAWTLWFLVTLVTMRILLPYIARLRHPLLFSTVLALVGGLLPGIGTEFSASRTLIFMPFFVAGWLVRERGWLDGDWFTRPARAARAAAWGLLAAVALVFVLVPQFKSWWRIDRWLTWRDDYFTVFERAPLGDWQPTQWGEVTLAGVLVTAVLLALAAAMTLAVLIVVPRAHSVITVWGARTLYVYLLHGPIVAALRATGFVDEVNSFGTFGMLLLVLLSVGVTVVLSMRWVSVLLGPIIEPRIDALFPREDRGGK